MTELRLVVDTTVRDSIVHVALHKCLCSNALRFMACSSMKQRLFQSAETELAA